MGIKIGILSIFLALGAFEVGMIAQPNNVGTSNTLRTPLTSQIAQEPVDVVYIPSNTCSTDIGEIEDKITCFDDKREWLVVGDHAPM